MLNTTTKNTEKILTQKMQTANRKSFILKSTYIFK